MERKRANENDEISASGEIDVAESNGNPVKQNLRVAIKSGILQYPRSGSNTKAVASGNRKRSLNRLNKMEPVVKNASVAKNFMLAPTGTLDEPMIIDSQPQLMTETVEDLGPLSNIAGNEISGLYNQSDAASDAAS